VYASVLVAQVSGRARSWDGDSSYTASSTLAQYTVASATQNTPTGIPSNPPELIIFGIILFQYYFFIKTRLKIVF
jgi:hypothetical protein